jgi:hypothetical protein
MPPRVSVRARRPPFRWIKPRIDLLCNSGWRMGTQRPKRVPNATFDGVRQPRPWPVDPARAAASGARAPMMPAATRVVGRVSNRPLGSSTTPPTGSAASRAGATGDLSSLGENRRRSSGRYRRVVLHRHRHLFRVCRAWLRRIFRSCYDATGTQRRPVLHHLWDLGCPLRPPEAKTKLRHYPPPRLD